MAQIHASVAMWHGAEDNRTPVALTRYMAARSAGCAITYVPHAAHTDIWACIAEVMQTLAQTCP